MTAGLNIFLSLPEYYLCKKILIFLWHCHFFSHLQRRDSWVLSLSWAMSIWIAFPIVSFPVIADPMKVIQSIALSQANVSVLYYPLLQIVSGQPHWNAGDKIVSVIFSAKAFPSQLIGPPPCWKSPYLLQSPATKLHCQKTTKKLKLQDIVLCFVLYFVICKRIWFKTLHSLFGWLRWGP